MHDKCSLCHLYALVGIKPESPYRFLQYVVLTMNYPGFVHTFKCMHFIRVKVSTFRNSMCYFAFVISCV